MDRTIAPTIYSPEKLNTLYPKVSTTENGVKLYTIDASELDVVRLSLVFKAGTRFQSRPFLASATLNLLSEGSENYSAAEISEKIDFYGAYFDVNIDRDYSVVSLCCLSRFLPEMLELLEEIVIHPKFSDDELNIYKSKRKQQIKIEREKMSFKARELFGEALFGKGHPYGSYSDADEYDTLTVSDLQSFYDKSYSADNCFGVASGKISEEETTLMLGFMEKLRRGNNPIFNDLPEARSIEKVYEHRPGAVQSAIRIGKLMFPRTHPDYIAMQLLCTVLGGYFGSRLVANLREEKGYTYSVFSTMVNLESSGYLAIATEVGAQFTQSAIDEIFGEMARLRNELIGEDELSTVKNIITGEYMRILDGPFGIADVTIENIQCGCDNSYQHQFIEQIKSITPEQLQAMAKKHLSPEGFVTVIVGENEQS